MNDLRVRVEQKYGFRQHPDANAAVLAKGGASGAATASSSAETHKRTIPPMMDGDRHDRNLMDGDRHDGNYLRHDGPQQTLSASPAPEARQTGSVSDIHVPPLKLPSRRAEEPHVEGLDHAAADAEGGGNVIGVETVSGGITADGFFARSGLQFDQRSSTLAWDHREGSTKANDHQGMPLSSIPQVTAGPWGGRRWIPPSSRHPRRAQVLISPAFLSLPLLLATHVMMHCMRFTARPRQAFLSHEGGVGYVFGCGVSHYDGSECRERTIKVFVFRDWDHPQRWRGRAVRTKM